MRPFTVNIKPIATLKAHHCTNRNDVWTHYTNYRVSDLHTLWHQSRHLYSINNFSERDLRVVQSLWMDNYVYQ